MCLHTLPIPWNRIKRPTNFAMSLVTQWKEQTSRATSFGRSVLQNNPSGALMPGKVIGCGWTHVLTLLRWESSTSLMLFASTRKGPGGSCNPSPGHPFLPCVKGCLSRKYAEEYVLAYASAYSD